MVVVKSATKIEKRIYVVVAETVQADSGHSDFYNDVVVQPAGRIAAQVGHVVSKMRTLRLVGFDEYWKPITTIILSVKNSKEMDHIQHVLGLGSVAYESFLDENDEYGWKYNAHGIASTEASVVTALCTHPIEPSEREGLLDHLPLWTPRCQG